MDQAEFEQLDYAEQKKLFDDEMEMCVSPYLEKLKKAISKDTFEITKHGVCNALSNSLKAILIEMSNDIVTSGQAYYKEQGKKIKSLRVENIDINDSKTMDMLLKLLDRL